MNLDLLASVAIVVALSFASVIFISPKLIKKMIARGIVSKDANKAGTPLVPKYGGIVIAFGFILASVVSLQLMSASIDHELMLAAICSIVIIALLGVLDDILDIPDKYRVVFPAFAALPLMVVKAGAATMNLFFFTVNFDLGVIALPLLGAVSVNLYPLLLIPIGVVACSNLVNLLAGFNGLEAGVGAIVSLFLGLAAVFLFLNGAPGSVEAALILFSLFGACLGFLVFNWYPAKMFPGNVATYLIGAAIVAAVVIGNFEKAGVIALIPQIAEFILKARSRFKAENFGKPGADGRLHYEGKTYSLTHFLMKRFSPTEPQIVLMLLAIQTVFGALALASVVL